MNIRYFIKRLSARTRLISSSAIHDLDVGICLDLHLWHSRRGITSFTADPGGTRERTSETGILPLWPQFRQPTSKVCVVMVCRSVPYFKVSIREVSLRPQYADAVSGAYSAAIGKAISPSLCQRRRKNLPVRRSKSLPFCAAPWGVMPSNSKHDPRRVGR